MVAGQPLHLIQRGHNRAAPFFADADYQCYRDALGEASQRFGCAIHAYALMTNHEHLLITPDDERGPARLMQAVGRRYVRYINAHYRRTGTLWEGRYRSALIDSDHYLLACSRYIELNPVRAGRLAAPAQYRWSGYRHNAGGVPDAPLTPHALYQALCRTRLDAQTLAAIRRATHDGTVLGHERFRAQIEAVLQRRVTRLAHGGDRRSAAFRMMKEQR